MTANLLEINQLVAQAPGRGWRAEPYRILHGVDLHIAPGQTLGLVGESGSGKTTIGRVILGLFPAHSGRIIFDGNDLEMLRSRTQRAEQIQAIFQDPYSSLNPLLTIGASLTEPLRQARWSSRDAARRVKTLLDRVALPQGAFDRYPSEFSGGQRQRIAIARSLVRSPRLIVCDEPVSALDLATQARVLDLLIELQRETGVSYLFISHDLAVVRRISHRVAVIRHGKIIEDGPADQVTEEPQEDYTRNLLNASPLPDPIQQAQRRAAWLAKNTPGTPQGAFNE
ncbi:peptide/nickel transport system ATP-binding protein [Paenarthrobacter nicotinovorans]|uniref:ABC transporter ATP-binding protein n=1 Tax=Paenarthrobacter nicotinovorans TaxID=29320 RepID=UPI002781F9E7|nr:ATP-binding cassette domain-containing protein [Paenarthrobacter nicotinovorans]MDP9933739.1 peptide/nickel transport system ATP-binding protein [Paenarthrobacter nicotinovorans]